MGQYVRTTTKTNSSNERYVNAYLKPVHYSSEYHNGSPDPIVRDTIRQKMKNVTLSDAIKDAL